MEKQLANLGYWLGLICAVLALILRALGGLHMLPPNMGPINEHAISYMSFLRAAVLFFLLSIASWCRSQKS